MADSRIDELRRRLERDPASRLFAQLAEEHRKAGNHAEAVRVARTGLAQHPSYASARLTLGRKKYLPVEEQMESVLEQAEALLDDPDMAELAREEADTLRQALPALETRLRQLAAGRWSVAPGP